MKVARYLYAFGAMTTLVDVVLWGTRWGWW
jgi:hypothetical protein